MKFRIGRMVVSIWDNCNGKIKKDDGTLCHFDGVGFINVLWITNFYSFPTRKKK